MRGNDQPVVRTSCDRSWRRGVDRRIVLCEGGLEQVVAAKGELIGFRCVRCGAHYDTNRLRIRDKAPE